MGPMYNKASAYQQMGVQSQIVDASPHRLIQMLMEGAIDKMAAAKGHIQRNDIQQIGNSISMAIAIVDGLRMSLDKTLDNDIVHNLDALYDYMGRRLLDANLKKDATIVEEVSKLMREIKSGWDAIEPAKT